MLRRVITLALAVLVGATPIARELCVVSCAAPPTAAAIPSAHGQHGGAHAMAGHDMPGHEMPGHEMPGDDVRGQDAAIHATSASRAQVPAAAGSDERAMACCTPGVAIGSSDCAPGGEWQAASAPTAKLALDAPAVLPRVDGVADPPGRALSSARVALAAHSPVPLALRTPLRV